MSLQDRMSSPDGVLSAARAVRVLSPSCSEEDPERGRVPFNELLKRFRRRIRLPQSGLAGRVGVSQPTVTRWETGECLPPRKLFLMEAPDDRPVGVGSVLDFLFRQSLSLAPSEWERLRASYEKACLRVYGDPRRAEIRSLSRIGLKYDVKPRIRPRKPTPPSTSRVHRLRAARILKEAFVLDVRGRPVSDELLERILSTAREADSLFLLSGLTRTTANLVYSGFRRKVLKAALDLYDRNPPGRPGRPEGS